MKAKTTEQGASVEGVAPRSEARRVKSVDRVIALLDSYSEDRPYITLSEAATLLDMHKSSASRLLRQLADEGFLSRDASGHQYGIGIRLFEIGSLYTRSDQLVALGDLYLRRLGDETGQTAQLCIRDGRDSVVVASVESRRHVKAAANLGGRLPLPTTASGRCLMTGLTGSEIEGLVYESLPAELDLDRLLVTVQKDRRAGVSVAVGDYRPELLAVAAPVYAPDKTLRAALCVVAPDTRQARSHLGDYKAAARTMASALSRELSGTS